jgi:hypothetical protein
VSRRSPAARIGAQTTTGGPAGWHEAPATASAGAESAVVVADNTAIVAGRDVGTTAAARSYFDTVLPAVPQPLSTPADAAEPGEDALAARSAVLAGRSAGGPARAT